MRQYSPETGLGVVCGLFGKSRQAYYKQQRVAEGLVMRDAIVIKTVKDIRTDMPRIGTRKLHYLLTDTLTQHGLDIGRDKLFDLLSDFGMLVRRRKRKNIYTTDSNHPFRKYPNMIRDLVPATANQLWVSEITYITLTGQFCYLSLVTDAYSRKIVGYRLYPTLEKEGPLSALQMALAQWEHHSSLIHHSDRGLQYCCGDYISMLGSNGIAISMTEKGDPYENAIAERINGILKHEFGINQRFRSFDEAAGAICRAIQTYNEQRPHSSCDYLTPAEAHKTEGLLTTKWKPKNEVIPVV